MRWLAPLRVCAVLLAALPVLVAVPPTLVRADEPVFIEVRPLRVVYDQGLRAGYLTTVLRFADAAHARRACGKIPAVTTALVQYLFKNAVAVNKGKGGYPPTLNAQAMTPHFQSVVQGVLGPDMAGRVYVVAGMVPKKNVQRQGYPFPRPLTCGALAGNGRGGG